MNFKNKTIIKPFPSDEYLSKKEKAWRVKLPESYKEFIKKYGGYRKKDYLSHAGGNI